MASRDHRGRRHDIYLIDQQLPDGTGLDLIHAAKSRGRANRSSC
jgi:hypothetical protein